MADTDFSRADVIAAMSDGARSSQFFAGRARALGDADVLPVACRTAKGQARYVADALIVAAVCNCLMDWGLQHSEKLPDNQRANPSRSPFWAVAEALDGHTLDLIANGVLRGQDWLLRVDMIPDSLGRPTYLVRPYPITKGGSYGETPTGATSTLSIGLRPLISRLLEEA